MLLDLETVRKSFILLLRCIQHSCHRFKTFYWTFCTFQGLANSAFHKEEEEDEEFNEMMANQEEEENKSYIARIEVRNPFKNRNNDYSWSFTVAFSRGFSHCSSLLN